MANYLQRAQAPFDPGERAAIDQMVVRTAHAMRVGRRFIRLVGPFGPGIESLPNDVLVAAPAGSLTPRRRAAATR